MRRTPSSPGASLAHPNRGAAHTRVTRRLTGTITQATVCQPGGQNGVRHDESRLTGPHVAVGLTPSLRAFALVSTQIFSGPYIGDRKYTAALTNHCPSGAAVPATG